MKQCEVCGTKEGNIHNSAKLGKVLCGKHYAQLNVYGEIRGRTIREPNKFIVSGDIVEIILYDKHSKEIAKTVVDLSKYDVVSKYKWCLSDGYIATKVNGKKTYLHRLIVYVSDTMFIDHINGNKLDNRESNLRVCTNQENSFNKGLQSNNKSGYAGVCWHNKSNKWQARISYSGKAIHLGVFIDINDAIESRRAAEVKYFGEFRYTS